MNDQQEYYPNNAEILSVEAQFTLKTIAVSIRKMSHAQLVKYFLDTMVLFLKLKIETNKLIDIMQRQKQVSQEALSLYKATITNLKNKAEIENDNNR